MSPFQAMDSGRWQQIEQLYHQAQARPAGERAAFLVEACAGDDALRREVEALLNQPAPAEGFVARAALAMAGQSRRGARVLC